MRINGMRAVCPTDGESDMKFFGEGGFIWHVREGYHFVHPRGLIGHLWFAVRVLAALLRINRAYRAARKGGDA